VGSFWKLAFPRSSGIVALLIPLENSKAVQSICIYSFSFVGLIYLLIYFSVCEIAVTKGGRNGVGIRVSGSLVGTKSDFEKLNFCGINY